MSAYARILVGLDGSACSQLAMQAALALAGQRPEVELIGCHVYAASLHRGRFAEMEPGLPDPYQQGERLHQLRHTHASLIEDGLQIISDAYLAPLLQAAQAHGVTCQTISRPGTHYATLLEVIEEHQPDLVVLGAWGHGRVPESGLGGLVERVLMYAHACDVLVVRRAWSLQGQAVLVGVDGSPCSYAAVQRAAELARTAGAQLQAVAVYDPFFHREVFQVIAQALPESSRERFDFGTQQQLHDEIIDQGLKALYQSDLEQGVSLARQLGVEADSQLLTGKVFAQLYHYAAACSAALVTVGRQGRHHQAPALIGSNTLNLARLCTTNLLVVAPPRQPPQPSETVRQEAEAPIWTPEAEARLQQVPAFARPLARRAIEARARQLGINPIPVELVRPPASGADV